ncbi:FkbM family methyltransferase [Caenimonas koreensis]|uniref:FkbM family methyltransferase n=1 Tax=Caenimonas koreensis DSM 17982 TaxID=1121255 RepID=A0A844B8V0_9BURK|nr:FkbM family methyltransferase [Caenimonas koreensis]MRD46951.1 FkbM family methyltransferase [Caenimonas koreensis DSM 17982]
MAFVSYTRNFEDVYLNRVFGNIAQGFFVDVGAHYPVIDSNTYGLYKRGWRGIAIEPLPECAPDWARFRRNDIYIAAAAGNTSGNVTFFQFEGRSQNATTSAETVRDFQALGVPATSVTVPMVTLDEVLAKHRPQGPIHVISIDVEGAEKAVLEGIDLNKHRPWLIMLESVLPGRPIPNYAGWEPLLLERGYEFVYFDAVNRYYLAREQIELKRYFQFPPNVWDNFVDYRIDAMMQQLAATQAELAALKQPKP